MKQVADKLNLSGVRFAATRELFGLKISGATTQIFVPSVLNFEQFKKDCKGCVFGQEFHCQTFLSFNGVQNGTHLLLPIRHLVDPHIVCVAT